MGEQAIEQPATHHTARKPQYLFSGSSAHQSHSTRKASSQNGPQSPLLGWLRPCNSILATWSRNASILQQGIAVGVPCVCGHWRKLRMVVDGRGAESEEGREGGSRVGIVEWCDDAGGVWDGEPVQSQGGRGIAWRVITARC